MRTWFEPDGILDIYYAAYGGLINKPTDAVDYARVLLRSKPALAHIPKSDLQAEGRDKVWHVMARMPLHVDYVEVLSFSRKTGKMLSGDL